MTPSASAPGGNRWGALTPGDDKGSLPVAPANTPADFASGAIQSASFAVGGGRDDRLSVGGGTGGGSVPATATKSLLEATAAAFGLKGGDGNGPHPGLCFGAPGGPSPSPLLNLNTLGHGSTSEVTAAAHPRAEDPTGVVPEGAAFALNNDAQEVRWSLSGPNGRRRSLRSRLRMPAPPARQGRGGPGRRGGRGRRGGQRRTRRSSRKVPGGPR